MRFINQIVTEIIGVQNEQIHENQWSNLDLIVEIIRRYPNK